jgi:uncharacterized Rmd1/YagE family protein
MAELGTQFEVRAYNVGEAIEIKGAEGRPSPPLAVIDPCESEGVAILLRSGVVVLFGVPKEKHRPYIESIASRITEKYQRFETEHALVRIGDADGVELDALVISEGSIEKLSVIAEVLGKSVLLARSEAEVARTFPTIEPLALQMSERPNRLRFNQNDLIRQIGDAMLVQHHLVGSAAVLEKPDLLWDSVSLDRLYTRLEDEYELRERHLALERKLTVVTHAAQTMLELHQTRRSYKVEWYIVGLFVFEIVFNIGELIIKGIT